MTCKKCNNTLQPSDGVCKVCGTPVRKKMESGKGKYIKVIAVVLVLSGCVLLLLMHLQGRLDLSFFTNLFSRDAAQIEDTLDEAIDDENEGETPHEEDEPIIIKDEEYLQNAMEAMHQAVLELLVEGDNIFVSNAGYLYNFTQGEFVTAGLFEEGLDNKKILYLRPASFADVDEANLPTSNNLVVFIARETITGIALYSTYGHHHVFRESLNGVLSEYAWGPLRGYLMPDASHSIFQSSLNIIRSHENQQNIHMRHLITNERFAFATVSTPGQSHILRHYILSIYPTSEIKLVITEGGTNTIQVINNALPAFDLYMLPDWDFDHNTLLSDGHNAVVIDLYRRGHIAETDLPQFISRTEYAAFAVFSHSSFLIHNSQVFPVRDWDEALGLGLSFPFYILLQN
ncbi:MAG: hypothetical protein FWC69_04025 [Defluviitaleaceae bacterium]|nr:hypothetical protein [Defluviitaleaceae bacterium]